MAQTQPQSHTVNPILASTLLDDDDLDVLVGELLVGDGHGTERKKKMIMRNQDERALEIGVKEVDELLGGGVKGGRMVGVSGEVNGGGEAVGLTLTLLTKSLLTRPTSHVAVIDTTGNLDVLRIYSLLITHLRQNQQLLRAQQTATNSTHSDQDQDVESVAAKVLERVKIMRVFDLEGVIEAVGEIGEGLEGRREEPKNSNVGEKSIMNKTKSVPAPAPQKKTEIADSEDEDEDEDEMLFDDPQAEHISIIPLEVHAEPERAKTPESMLGSLDMGEDEAKVSFVLIDNLAHVLTPLLKKDYAQASSQSTALLFRLAHLTHTHNLHTILLNPSALPQRPSTSTSSAISPDSNLNPNAFVPVIPQNGRSNPYSPPPPPSIFSSVPNVPVLAHILPQYLDLHLLVSSVPKGKADARVVYADGGVVGGVGARSRMGVEILSVVEVLADRWGESVGAWGVLTNVPQSKRW